jgi:hypothetical protein
VKAIGEAASEAGGDLNVFMQKVRSSALLEEEKHSSWTKGVVNYFSASWVQSVGAVAAIAMVLLMVGLGAWRHIGGLQPEPQVEAVKMDSQVNGDYDQVVAKIQGAYTQAQDKKVSKSGAAAQVEEINQGLSKLDNSKLQPEQKEKLEALQFQYQRLLFDRLHNNLGTYGGAAKVQNVESDFFSHYAEHLAQDGQPLTISPPIWVESSGLKLSVIGKSAAGGQEVAAEQAVRDLQSQHPEMVLEYRAAPTGAAAGMANPSSN